MSRESEQERLMEQQLPETAYSAVQGCSVQLGQTLMRSIVSVLQDGDAETLANARVQLARVNGLCRMFGARRAALYCSELECLLLHCIAGREQWAHARTQAITQNTTQIGVQALLVQAVVQLQHFLLAPWVLAADEAFAVSCINVLRKARGKAALPIDVCTPDASCTETAPSRTASSHTASSYTASACGRFPVPDFPQRVLEKIATLQAALQSTEETDEQAACEWRQHLADLVSVLEICGLPVEMRRLPVALVHLEWHFRHLSVRCLPCTPERLANTSRLAAGEYLLMEGRSSLLAILADKVATLLLALSQAVRAGPGQSLTRSLSRVAQDFLRFSQSLGLLIQGGMLPAMSSSHESLVQHGRALCRHVSSSVVERFFDDDSAVNGAALLMRVCLSLQKALTRHGTLDRHPVLLARKICRDSARFVLLRQSALRHRMIDLHCVDNELLSMADSEVVGACQTLSACLEELRTVQGIHYVSETLCTTVSKLSQVFLVTGQVACHEIVEQLRECLTRGLEQQQRIGNELQECIAALCEVLQRSSLMNANDVLGNTSEWTLLCDCIDRCMRQMEFSCSLDDSSVSFICHSDVCHSDIDRQSRADIAVAQLPVHLARNIRDLLCSAEELAMCVANPERFNGLNRRLIVELRMLAAGARALRVDRVAALSAVLAEVHQEIAGDSEQKQTTADNERELPLALLVMAHRQLRSGLNQAAARQEVSSSREIIAVLYQWLEDHATQGFTDDAEGFAIFHREAEEIMASIEESTGRPADVLDTATLLHHLHTLKGSARLFGADEVATLSHRFEQLLQELTRKNCSASAVAECGPGVSYVSANEEGDELRYRKVSVLVQALRAAIDGLISRAPRAQDGEARSEDCRLSQRVPLAQPYERGVVIPAISLRRMAELAAAARTGSRSMSDVLQSYRVSAEPSRLNLLADLLVEQDRCTVQLDEEIAGSTRISFARLTQRLQRLVGRHANLVDRQVSFHVSHDELRADRALIESLVAPVEQLLRNAIDHGIEPVLERRARGKPDIGTITLTLEETNDQLLIVLMDDGAGVDTDALPGHALRLGIDVDLQAEPAERLRWLFLPGFSSRESATQDAGHGIGLAMVSTAVAALGGRVEVESVPGQSCCFRIVLPR